MMADAAKAYRLAAAWLAQALGLALTMANTGQACDLAAALRVLRLVASATLGSLRSGGGQILYLSAKIVFGAGASRGQPVAPGADFSPILISLVPSDGWVRP